MFHCCVGRSRIHDHTAFFAIACLAAVIGCDNGDAPDESDAPPARPTAAVSLRLVVVDDVEMADAIRRRRDVWAARSSGSLEVGEMTSAELVAGADISADAVVYPSQYLGTLAEGERIVPVRNNVLRSDDYKRADIFPLVAERAVVWSDRAMAVPLGSRVLVLYYRTDLLEQVGRGPPTTWEEYQQLVELLTDRTNLGAAVPPADEPWYAAVEPLSPGWAGRMLLARAASYAKHRDRFSTLFDIETMESLIAGPAFVRALEEMLTVVRLTGMPRVNVSEAYDIVRSGQAAMAVTWPTPKEAIDADRSTVELAVAELPGASVVYGAVGGEPESRGEGERLVPVLGLAGRLGSVTRESKNAPAAFRLLVWLSSADAESGAQVSPASQATTLFRRSHVRSPSVWSPPGTPTSTAQGYAQVVEQTLNRETWLPALRIPGGGEYLAALDRAVDRALSGEESPKESLAAAAAEWSVITERLGVESQRAAYRHSLAW